MTVPDDPAAHAPQAQESISEAELDAVVNELKEQYSALLPAILDELDQTLAKARDRNSDEIILIDAKSMAHRLSGTVGSYGFDALSRRFGELEILMNDIIEKVHAGDDGAEKMWDRIEEKQKEIRAALPA